MGLGFADPLQGCGDERSISALTKDSFVPNDLNGDGHTPQDLGAESAELSPPRYRSEPPWVSRC